MKESAERRVEGQQSVPTSEFLSRTPGARRKVLLIAGACSLLGVITLMVFIGVTHRQRALRVAETQTLSEKLDAAIEDAESAAAAYDFDAAIESLARVECEVCNRGSSEAEDRYWTLVGELNRRKQDHEVKRLRGWRMFEGRFVSAEMEDAILEQRRCEEKKRREDEAARAEAERQREIEQERLLRQKEKQEADDREVERKLAEQSRRLALYDSDPGKSFESFAGRFVTALSDSVPIRVYNDHFDRYQFNRLVVASQYEFDLQRTNSEISPYLGWIQMHVSLEVEVDGEVLKGESDGKPIVIWDQTRLWFAAHDQEWQFRSAETRCVTIGMETWRTVDADDWQFAFIVAALAMVDNP